MTSAQKKMPLKPMLQNVEVFKFIPDETPEIAVPAKAPPPERKGDGLLSVQEVKPSLAFETFAGRVYDTTSADFSDSAFKERIVHVGSRRPEFAAFGGPLQRFESPLDRYNRIKTEIREFQQDLDQLVKQSAANKADPVRDVSDLIHKDLVGLEKELGNLVNDEKVKPFIQPSAAGDLTDLDLVGKLMTELDRATGKAPAKGKDDGKKSAAAATSTTATPTFELFYAGSGATAEQKKEQLDLVQLDRRLAVLEKSIGQTTEASPAFPDIQTGLRVVSKKMDLLDEAKLEGVSKRVKRLRDELDALESQKATLKGAKPSPHEDKVSQLYAMMSRWDKAAQTVPNIITRLQTLRDIHEECGTLVLRVQNVEKQHDSVDRMLKEDKAALEKLSESLATNAKLMQTNVGVLEGKFNALSQKVDQLLKSRR